MSGRVTALAMVIGAVSVGAGSETLTASATNGIVLRVVRCSTVYGLPRDQYSIPGVPHSLAANVAAEVRGRLSFYSNGWLTILAPRGWHCTGVVGATGALDLDVLPPGVPTSPSSSRSRADGVTARIPSPGTGEVGAAACPLFSRAWPAPAFKCHSIPVGERVVRLNAATVAFEDPPNVAGDGDPSGGPDPANGVVMYKQSRAANATCTLPQSEHATCTTILNDFIARHRL